MNRATNRIPRPHIAVAERDQQARDARRGTIVSLRPATPQGPAPRPANDRTATESYSTGYPEVSSFHS